jgi:hypothetical protein
VPIEGNVLSIMRSFAMTWLDWKSASTFWAKSHVTIDGHWSSKHFEITYCFNDFSAMRGHIAESNNTAAFTILHFTLTGKAQHH